MRNVVEPTVTVSNEYWNRGAERESHPAFGFILASRVSGNTNLYDSDFNHQNYVMVTIGRSTRQRNHSEYSTYDESELIQVSMSETQWGHFVSAMNASSTPCTLERGPMPDSGYKYSMIPDLPAPKPVIDKFDKELRATMAEAMETINKMQQQLNNPEKPLSKKDQLELARELGQVRNNIGVNVGFVAEQFSEHVEKTVDKAKSEFNAYRMHSTLQVGVNALTNDIVLGMPTLEYKNGA
jgi:hypothetical protein